MKKKLSEWGPYCCKFLGIFLVSVVLSVITVKLLSFIAPTLGLSEEEVGTVAGLAQSNVAAISICFLVYQLKKGDETEERQRNIAEAQFILQYNRVFIENGKMAEVERMLEDFAYSSERKPMLTTENRQDFINYLVYFEGLAQSILRNEVNLDRIDDLMGYRFFLIMNCPEILREELGRFPDYYRGCIKLYARWKDYRVSHHKPIPLSGTALDLTWDEYHKYVGSFSEN